MWQSARGRPRKDAPTKDPLHQLSSPGGVTKVGKMPNVIVVPIQISKEMIAAKQGEKAAASGAASTAASGAAPTSDKSKPSPEKASPKTAGTSKAKGSDTDDAEKETPKTGTKAKKAATATPKSDSTEPKSDQSSPEPTRRSKRESKLSVKLVEWGLLPSAGTTVCCHGRVLCMILHYIVVFFHYFLNRYCLLHSAGPFCLKLACVGY